MSIRLLYSTGLLLLLLLTASSGAQEQAAEANDLPLERLRSYLTGSFSSGQQAAADSAFFSILLHTVPLWTDRTDGHWLYVEQAAASSPEKPYRQRVYRLSRLDDSTLISRVYTFAEPLRFAGIWQQATPDTPFTLGRLTPDSLSERTGCAILLRAAGDTSFTGSTDGTGCPSELRGAAYATSEVSIYPSLLKTWDRGFDSSGVQVWGSASGPYLFTRMLVREHDSLDALDLDRQ